MTALVLDCVADEMVATPLLVSASDLAFAEEAFTFIVRDKAQSNCIVMCHVGVTDIKQAVHRWVSARVNPVSASQRKDVFVVDGIVKSGKTTIARHLVPYFAVQHPSGFFKPNTISIYVDMFVLSSCKTFADKESAFCQVLLDACSYTGLQFPTPPEKKIIHTTNSLRAMTMNRQVIVTLDEFHFLFSGLLRDDRVKMASLIKYMTLFDQHKVYFVITSSTQPLLWTSLDYALANGVSLLHSPEIFTTPLSARKELIFDTISPS
eukprot:Phypoly_transcript_07076.p1 GENE.Phypoly_transcript_07076~~Phypoly_transcript_07076.p1  ORF type:complete len:283 (+),score=22.64 Phypoly_transcript_07076:58-849(+)